jgi:hypothetical protein
MADENDIVRDFELMALEMKPKTPEEWRSLTVELRRKWGGERHYVQKAPPLGKAHALSGSLAAGASPREACVSLGFSLRTAQRLIRRGWVGSY